MGYVPPPPGPADLIRQTDLIRQDLLRSLVAIYGLGSEFLRSQPTAGCPVRLNLDRFGLPRDFATYMWLVYKREVVDESPARRAFLDGPPGNGWRLPEADPALMGTAYF